MNLQELVSAIIEAAKTGNAATTITTLITGFVETEAEPQAKKMAGGLVEQATAGLKKKNEELLTELRGLKAYKDLGTFEEVKNSLGELAGLRTKVEKGEPLDQERLDAAIAEALRKRDLEHEATVRAFEEKVGERDQKIDSQTGLLRQQSIAHALYRAAGSEDVYPEFWEILTDKLSSVFHFEDDNFQEFVLKDPKTDQFLIGKDGPMTVDELMAGARLSAGKNAWDSGLTRVFKARGTGSGAGAGGGAGAPAKPLGEMSQQDMVDYIKANGGSAFQELPNSGEK